MLDCLGTKDLLEARLYKLFDSLDMSKEKNSTNALESLKESRETPDANLESPSSADSSSPKDQSDCMEDRMEDRMDLLDDSGPRKMPKLQVLTDSSDGEDQEETHSLASSRSSASRPLDSDDQASPSEQEQEEDEYEEEQEEDQYGEEQESILPEQDQESFISSELEFKQLCATLRTPQPWTHCCR